MYNSLNYIVLWWQRYYYYYYVVFNVACVGQTKLQALHVHIEALPHFRLYSSAHIVSYTIGKGKGEDKHV